MPKIKRHVIGIKENKMSVSSTATTRSIRRPADILANDAVEYDGAPGRNTIRGIAPRM
jgi:hypothetical protein